MKKNVLYLQFINGVNEKIIDEPPNNQTKICQTDDNSNKKVSIGSSNLNTMWHN